MSPLQRPKPARSAARVRTRAPLDALPARAPCVLLLVDFINPLDFAGADDLTQAALEAAGATAALKAGLRAQGVPAVYVNDNFGLWQSDFRTLLAHCRRRHGPAAGLVRRLAPVAGDLVVLKPRQSAFHQTPLELLLMQMGTRELVVTGLATNLCVQFSAMDAFLRGFKLWVPEDCTAAETYDQKRAALDWMAHSLQSRIDRAGS